MNLQEAIKLLKDNDYIVTEGVIDNIRNRYTKADIANVDLIAEVEDDGAKAWLEEISDVITSSGCKIVKGDQYFGKESLDIINPVGQYVGYISIEVETDKPKYYAGIAHFKKYGSGYVPTDKYVTINWRYNSGSMNFRHFTYLVNKDGETKKQPSVEEVTTQWYEDLDFLKNYR